MRHTLIFGSRVLYDPGDDSITIPVVLTLGQTRVTAMAKVDTGSSHCVFSREVGEQLGLRVEDGQEMAVGTVTGGFITYGHNVAMAAAGIEMDTLIYFAAHEGFPRNVLGRRGWIDRLRLGLVDYDGELFVSQYDDEA